MVKENKILLKRNLKTVRRENSTAIEEINLIERTK
jgi:hypothetical protein